MKSEMKTIGVLVTIIFTTHMLAQKNEEIVLEGEYSGKNIFIKNPFSIQGGGVCPGFCVQQVKVNGNTCTDEINAEIFQVDLSLHKLKPGDKIKVQVFHKNCCMPFIMNPNAIKPKENTLKIAALNIGASLFVMNPRTADGKGFSVKEVYIDGKKVTLTINAEIFELDFNKLGVKYMEECKIEFKYENGYDPFFVNPDMFLK